MYRGGGGGGSSPLPMNPLLIDVTQVTSRFYKLPPFNVWGAVAHTYLFFFCGLGVNGIAKTINPSIAQDRRRAELHGAMSFVSLRHREVELLLGQRETFGRIF